jgi:multidrug efflux system outer membrane protein
MRAFALVLSVLVAGCVVGPKYERPEIALPASFDETGSTDGALTVPPDWWTLYRDPLLDELVEAGLAQNADVRQATARVREAEGVLRETHATLAFPLIQGNAGVTRSATQDNGVRTGYALGLFTSFEIDVWGRLRSAEAATQERLLAAKYTRDTVAITLAATIARTYFAARSLDSQYRASDEILRAATDGEALAKKRLDAGVASALDFYQASALRTAASAQAKEIARQRATMVHQLGALVGRSGYSLPEGDVTTLPLVPPPPAGLPSHLLERRPDVRAAEATLIAATHRIGVARAEQFPALSLTGSLGTQSGLVDSLFSPAGKVWSLGAGVLGPIIDGGRYAARTDQAEAQARQAEAAWQKTVETAFREVADALSSVRYSSESEADLQLRVEQSRNALRLANSRYERGYSAYLEVLDAQRTLNEALLAFIRNRQAHLSYSVDLMNALGGGWATPG